MRKLLLCLVLIMPMLAFTGCNDKTEGKVPAFINNVCGVTIGQTAQQALDSLRLKGYTPQISGDGIQFININQKIAIDNLIFDEFTAYSLPTGIYSILLRREFNSETKATSFFNEALKAFESKYNHYKSSPNSAQLEAYKKCSSWTDSINHLDLGLYLNYHPFERTPSMLSDPEILHMNREYWEVGVMLSDTNIK